MTPRDGPLTKPVAVHLPIPQQGWGHKEYRVPFFWNRDSCLKRVGEPTILDLLVTKASKTAQRASGRR